MSAEKALALVIRVVDFSETSAVVTLFTREFGKLSGLAKGSRRPKGPFESALDLLGLCRIVFLAKSSDALDLITEAKLERRFRPAGHDLSHWYAGYYVAELLNELTLDRDPHPDLFDAACQTLAALGREECAAGVTVLRFELTALRLLGHLPSLDACVECGKPLASEGRASLGILAGGVLCATCRPGHKLVVSLSSAAWTALKALAEPAPMAAAFDTNLASDANLALDTDRRVLGSLRGVMNQYFSHLLGHKLRMHPYLGHHAG
ncbi:MAG: DNA repair protein RecO [Planctomycetes bacterium]|nr:DNA repair protein RecO [Planctomycetota bacterium]